MKSYNFNASLEGEWSLDFSVTEIIEQRAGPQKQPSYTGIFKMTYDPKFNAKPLTGVLSIKFDEKGGVYLATQFDNRAGAKDPWTLSLGNPDKPD